MQTELPQRPIPALRKRACLLAISLAVLGTAFAQPAPTTFTRITTGSIATDVGVSVGCAWGDYDNDGFEDLFVAHLELENDRLYRNNGDGTFTSILTGDIVNDGAESYGAVWGDYDNDGYLDLFVTAGFFSAQPNLLYRNQGDGTLAKVTAGHLVTNPKTGTANGAWGDYDNDGYLDLFIAQVGVTASALKDMLYRNDGTGGFTQILTGPVVNDSGRGIGGTWADYNGDGRPDLFVANETQSNLLYRNDGNGVFTQITTGPLACDASFGYAWGDFNNDGFLDLFVGNEGSGPATTNLLYQNSGGNTFAQVTTGSIATDTGRSDGCSWGDYDNDGFLDLFVCQYFGENNFLYRNNGDGTFTRVTEGSIVNDGGDSNGCSWADYDNDGFLDLFVSNALPGNPQLNFLYRNQGNSNQWLKIKCVGGPSNRAAIGAKIRVQARNSTGALFWQMREISGGHGLGQNSLIAHFGLGNATNALTVRIEWPSGIVQTLTNVAAKQLLTVTEPPLLKAGLADGSVQLLLTDNIGSSTDVEASTDLTEWDSIGTVTHTARTMPFVDPAADNQSWRFYRAVRQ